MTAPLVTAEDVRDYLRLQDSADSAWLADAAAAATDYVNGLSHVNDEDWDDRTRGIYAHGVNGDTNLTRADFVRECVHRVPVSPAHAILGGV